MDKENYLKIANEAANLERNGDFKSAIDKWLVAQNLATTKVDIQWCVHRAETCKLRGEKSR